MATSFAELDHGTLVATIEDFAKNWLAHDGLWFQAVERRLGLEAAIELDAQAWEQFTIIEAKRIMARYNIPADSGLEGLKRALGFRMYAVLNRQEIRNETDTSFEFFMVDCRVQSARQRKGMPLFPCKSVGLVEYSGFARVIDPRIKTSCLVCPPDKSAGAESYCGWKFSI